jgi:hypothetical protein
MSNYKRALRFADAAYRTVIEGYTEGNIETSRKYHYDKLVQSKNAARSEKEFNALVKNFKDMGGYKDTAELAEECEKLAREAAREAPREAKYNELINLKNAAAEKEFVWRNLSRGFRNMEGYRDTAKLAVECQERANALLYDELVRDMNAATSESKFVWLAKGFRVMDGYRNAAELARECDERARLLSTQRLQQEARDRQLQQKKEQLRAKMRLFAKIAKWVGLIAVIAMVLFIAFVLPAMQS